MPENSILGTVLVWIDGAEECEGAVGVGVEVAFGFVWESQES